MNYSVYKVQDSSGTIIPKVVSKSGDTVYCTTNPNTMFSYNCIGTGTAADIIQDFTVTSCFCIWCDKEDDDDESDFSLCLYETRTTNSILLARNNYGQRMRLTAPGCVTMCLPPLNKSWTIPISLFAGTGSCTICGLDCCLRGCMNIPYEKKIGTCCGTAYYPYKYTLIGAADFQSCLNELSTNEFNTLRSCLTCVPMIITNACGCTCTINITQSLSLNAVKYYDCYKAGCDIDYGSEDEYSISLCNILTHCDNIVYRPWNFCSWSSASARTISMGNITVDKGDTCAVVSYGLTNLKYLKNYECLYIQPSNITFTNTRYYVCAYVMNTAYRANCSTYEITSCVNNGCNLYSTLYLPMYCCCCNLKCVCVLFFMDWQCNCTSTGTIRSYLGCVELGCSSGMSGTTLYPRVPDIGCCRSLLFSLPTQASCVESCIVAKC